MRKIVGKCITALHCFALSALLLFCFAAQAHAQNESNEALPSQGMTAPGERRNDQQGGQLLQGLNLSPDQRAQIRAIREQSQEEHRIAMQRLRRAQRALDEAIYSNNADETLIEERAREVAAAQAATVRLHALTELRIRRVLTPEQLSTFRDLRRQALIERRSRRLQGNGNMRPQDDGTVKRPRERLDNPINQPQKSPADKDRRFNPAFPPDERRGNPSRQRRP